MNESPTNLLPIILFFIAALAFHYVVQWIARWRAQLGQPSRHHEPVRHDRQVSESSGRAPRTAPGEPRARIRRSEAPTITSWSDQPRPHARWLAGRRNLRRAIIAMTVLGPCRSQQSPDGN